MPKKRILLVDDDRSFTSLLKLNLEETGQYDVRVENWPEDAVSAVREFRPDVVLLDIIMPRIPGGNISATILNDPELKDTPIVFLTAAVRKHQVEDHEGIICDRPTLAKPASVEKVIETIEQFSRTPPSAPR
ncbi:MAG: response regulator [Verrucomicrobia bacterium]|nr:response regulator [Verrucomicrobiota bacterium]